MLKYEKIISNSRDFLNLIEGEQNANSFLIETEDRVLLHDFAYLFAKFLLCNDLCNVCSNCIKVNANTHPDIILLPLKKDHIVTDDIEFLLDKIYLAPIESDKKIFILDNFSYAEEVAQNKLLKVLEEPPKNSYIIILATNSSKVLPTVRSRCKKISLSKVSNELMRKFCEDETKLECANGSLYRLENFMQDENFSKMYESVLKTTFELKDSKVLLKYSTELASFQKNIEDILEIMQSFYRDSYLVSLGKKDLIRNKSQEKNIVELSRVLTCDGADKIVRKIDEAEKLYGANCIVGNFLDNLLLNILEVKYLCKR